MNLFIDKNHRRKSPIAIAGFFFATLLDLCIYGVLYTPCWQSRCTGSLRCPALQPPTPCTR